LERFDYTFRKGRKPAFAEVPQKHKRQLFGVDYIHLKGRQQGDFFVTSHGWAVMESLLPEHWFVGKRFCKVGRALMGATGAVYRVPVPHPGREDFAIVVKFSRFCQGVGITAVDPNLNFSQEQIDRIKSSHFLSPFEEFGNVQKLRKAAGLEIPLKAPLAIYSPPARYLDWQLGREHYLKAIHSRNLLESQADLPENERLDYDWERQYILLYRWINGVDAELAVDKGLISESQMVELGREARCTMAKHGWEVMDHKPRHVIIRQKRNDALARRKGNLLWGLVDYELLYPFAGSNNLQEQPC
jgi:hypothetical protein